MNKLITTSTLFFLLICPALQANNGQITFALPSKDLTIDADFSDWKAVPMTDVSDGLASEVTANDFKAQFQTAYAVSEKALYFRVEITDDDYRFKQHLAWYENDCLVLYFNPLHTEHAATAAMLILTETGITLEQPDFNHQFLQEKNISWELKTKDNKRFYEGKVVLDSNIADHRTVGFDLMVVDVDQSQETKYINWGSGAMKQYRSGQLGDLVLLNNPEIGTLKGQIKWAEDIPDPIPSSIKIKSTSHPALWVTAAVEKTGEFKTTLPTGTYWIQPASKIASPEADNGDYNQARIVDTFKLKTTIINNQSTDVGLVSIPTFKHPDFLYEKTGVLHAFDASKKQQLNTFITAISKYYNIPGASVAVIKNNNIVYYHHFGVENLLTKKPVTENTLFQAASVTKSVFAFMVLRLADQGAIDLDKPLYRYLGFPNIEHLEDYKLLTARLVLSHQSGLPNWAWGGPGGYSSGHKTELLFKPGTQFGYSGEAFAYLGRVVEKITNKGLNLLLKEEVIDALKIPAMYLMDNGLITQARGHYADGRPTYYGMPNEPGVAHTLLTEANAFAHFMLALSNKKGLSKAMYEQLETRLAFTSDFDSPENLYWNVGAGLGFFIQDTPYGKAILHGGNNGDFQAEFVLYTEQKMGFVVFTNSNTGHKLAQELGRYLIYGKN